MRTRFRYGTRASGVLEMLKGRPITHFVTLASNDKALTRAKARWLAKGWDARICRRLLGQRWSKYPDERPLAFYFLEKPESNPHWHALLELPTDHPDHELHCAVLERDTQPLWSKLKPGGTSRVSPVRDHRGAAAYVVKQLGYEPCYNEFIVPFEFEVKF